MKWNLKSAGLKPLDSSPKAIRAESHRLVRRIMENVVNESGQYSLINPEDERFKRILDYLDTVTSTINAILEEINNNNNNNSGE